MSNLRRHRGSDHVFIVSSGSGLSILPKSFREATASSIFATMDAPSNSIIKDVIVPYPTSDSFSEPLNDPPQFSWNRYAARDNEYISQINQTTGRSRAPAVPRNGERDVLVYARFRRSSKEVFFLSTICL